MIPPLGGFEGGEVGLIGGCGLIGEVGVDGDVGLDGDNPFEVPG